MAAQHRLDLPQLDAEPAHLHLMVQTPRNSRRPSGNQRVRSPVRYSRAPAPHRSRPERTLRRQLGRPRYPRATPTHPELARAPPAHPPRIPTSTAFSAEACPIGPDHPPPVPGRRHEGMLLTVTSRRTVAVVEGQPSHRPAALHCGPSQAYLRADHAGFQCPRLRSATDERRCRVNDVDLSREPVPKACGVPGLHTARCAVPALRSRGEDLHRPKVEGVGEAWRHPRTLGHDRRPGPQQHRPPRGVVTPPPWGDRRARGIDHVASARPVISTVDHPGPRTPLPPQEHGSPAPSFAPDPLASAAPPTGVCQHEASRSADKPGPEAPAPAGLQDPQRSQPQVPALGTQPTRTSGPPPRRSDRPGAGTGAPARRTIRALGYHATAYGRSRACCSNSRGPSRNDHPRRAVASSSSCGAPPRSAGQLPDPRPGIATAAAESAGVRPGATPSSRRTGRCCTRANPQAGAIPRQREVEVELRRAAFHIREADEDLAGPGSPPGRSAARTSPGTAACG